MRFCWLVFWLNLDWKKWFRLGIVILYLVYTFFTKKKNVPFFWKIESKWKGSFFKGSLGEVSDQRSVLAEKKDFVKKGTEVHFSIFIENRNWDLKFVFQFNNENEKRKKSKLYFILKQKSNVPFDPWIRAPKVTFNFQFKIEMEKVIFADFNF